jgi:hypothetical protein
MEKQMIDIQKALLDLVSDRKGKFTVIGYSMFLKKNVELKLGASVQKRYAKSKKRASVWERTVRAKIAWREEKKRLHSKSQGGVYSNAEMSSLCRSVGRQREGRISSSRYCISETWWRHAGLACASVSLAAHFSAPSARGWRLADRVSPLALMIIRGGV